MVMLSVAVAVLVSLVGGVLLAMMFRKVVPTNEVHVVQTGKKTKAYGKDTENGNVYYKIPSFVPVFGIDVKSLPVSIFEIELEEYDAYDKGRLQFLVDVTAFFRISDHAQAAQKVSSIDELEDQLNKIVKGSVRSILAKSEIEEIMEERSKFGALFTAEVTDQLKQWGVEAVKNIELMDVKDAPKSEIIHNIMAKKKSHIEMESRLEVAKNNKLAQVAEIEARREIDLGKQEAEQTVGLRTAQAKREVELAEEAKKQAVMEQSKLTAEKEMEVVRTKNVKTAEINRETAKIAAEKEREVQIIEANKLKEMAVIDANKTKESSIIKADAELQVKNRQADADLDVKRKQATADYEVKTKAAEADLITKTNNAKGLEAEGLAKAAAEKALAMVPVEAQTTLAKEIGENKEYQQYLITVERIKADQAVGVAQAAALSNASVKVIANTGNANDGLKSVGELFTSKGGTQLGVMLDALSNTDTGKKLLGAAGLSDKE